MNLTLDKRSHSSMKKALRVQPPPMFNRKREGQLRKAILSMIRRSERWERSRYTSTQSDVFSKMLLQLSVDDGFF